MREIAGLLYGDEAVDAQWYSDSLLRDRTPPACPQGAQAHARKILRHPDRAINRTVGTRRGFATAPPCLPPIRSPRLPPRLPHCSGTVLRSRPGVGCVHPRRTSQYHAIHTGTLSTTA